MKNNIATLPTGKNILRLYNLKQVEAYLLADIKAIFDNEK